MSVLADTASALPPLTDDQVQRIAALLRLAMGRSELHAHASGICDEPGIPARRRGAHEVAHPYDEGTQ